MMVIAAAALGGAAAASAAWRWGRASGIEEGWARSVLELHRRALAETRCPTCRREGSTVDERPRVQAEGLRVIKMHGLGNCYAFVDLFDAVEGVTAGMDWPAVARAISDRNTGLGTDGLILILPGRAAPAAMRIFNMDGSEGEMCGNGIRALAMWLHQRHGLPRRFDVETRAGVRGVEVVDSSTFGQAAVRVDMGSPGRDGPAGVPLGCSLTLDVPGFPAMEVWPISVGNPHVVTFVERVADAPVKALGPLIERHPAFPGRVNVEFVEVVGPGQLRMRVWERGSGETMACGTGACASVVAASLARGTMRAAQVQLEGGTLSIAWEDDLPEQLGRGYGRIWMTGPARVVVEGTVPRAWIEEAARR